MKRAMQVAKRLLRVVLVFPMIVRLAFKSRMWGLKPEGPYTDEKAVELLNHPLIARDFQKIRRFILGKDGETV